MPQLSQNQRRDAWFAATRARIGDFVNPDGTGKIPQFCAPYREPVWILPALYTGGPEDVALANRIVEHTFDIPGVADRAKLMETSGKEFGIFQSNLFAHCLHRFGQLLTPGAREVMEWHARETCKMFKGSAQPDFKFHGANDNMPMMATDGLICAGEALGIPQAIEHGIWNLNQARRLLSRSAWMSEFNSSTYSAITLTSAAKLATYAHDPEIRALALEIESRLWAEVLLHYHPPTFMQAGPQSRAYPIDYVGHNHTLQLILWMAFGPETVGRDMLKSYFEPDGSEVIHFAGCHFQTIAEFCDAIDTELHVPEHLAELISKRSYPAVLRGRSECISRFDDMAAAYHTETYMEEDFSVGTVNGPLCGGEQTASCHVTFKRRPEARTFRDAATVFFKYLTSNEPIGGMDISIDGGSRGEKFIASQGWCYSIQKRNVALLLATPNLKNAPIETDTLKLSVIFPAHYGAIERSVMGNSQPVDGARGYSEQVQPISVETGQVFIHVQPLIPTSLPREHAAAFTSAHNYEVLDLFNYSGPKRTFTRKQAALVLNGMVLTVESKSKFPSLEAFHNRMSSALVQDYYMASHRFFLFQRDDVEFEVVMTTDPFGVQTEAVDGRTVSRPIFESNQIDVSSLPFMSGEVARNRHFFPWPAMDICWYPDLPWMIGSRGLPEEPNYSRPQEGLK